jgi:hypothetical protein
VKFPHLREDKLPNFLSTTKKYSDRDVAILKAYKSGAYSMKIIGDYFELYYSRNNRISKAKSKTCPLYLCDKKLSDMKKIMTSFESCTLYRPK